MQRQMILLQQMNKTKETKMRQYERVFYHGTEWTFIEQIGDKYLLRSTNKNIDDVLADMGDVKQYIQDATA